MIDSLKGSANLYGQVEAFLAVASLGTVRAAADALNLSQPALSARITTLERLLDVRLFDRRKTGMTLSVAGRAFLPHAERVQEAAMSGIRIARDVGAGIEGEITVGSGPAVSAYVMPELIARFREICPRIRVASRTGMSEDIVEMVGRGHLDIGLVRPLPDHHLPTTELYHTDLLLLRSPDHSFDLSIPGEIPLILTARPGTYFQIARDLFRRLDITARHFIEVEGVETAKRMVLRGLGIALLPTTATATEVASGALISISIPEYLPIRRSTVAVEPPQPSDWAPIVAFRRLITEIPHFVPGTYPISAAG